MSQLANAIRFLSVDAVQKANSGHPGAPMGMAEMAEVLWTKFLNHNPANPKFYNRDRFVLSNGHASMILYSLLHLTGYNVSIDDLKISANCTAKPPVIRNMAIPTAWKPQPAHWDKVLPTLWAWLWPKKSWLPNSIKTV